MCRSWNRGSNFEFQVKIFIFFRGSGKGSYQLLSARLSVLNWSAFSISIPSRMETRLQICSVCELVPGRLERVNRGLGVRPCRGSTILPGYEQTERRYQKLPIPIRRRQLSTAVRCNGRDMECRSSRFRCTQSSRTFRSGLEEAGRLLTWDADCLLVDVERALAERAAG